MRGASQFATQVRIRALVRLRAFSMVIASLSIAVMSAAAPAAGDVAAGKGRFGLCESCHGVRAEGNQGLGAPALAGLQDWYLARQLENYLEGRRGTAAGDARAQQMLSMAQTLESPQAVADVVAYLATLPPITPSPSITGDVARGRQLYATCVTCHGDQGQGSESMQAPALRFSNDWYLLRQLEAFHDGRRGSAEGDTLGMQMRAMSSTLVDDAARRDVVAYLSTLNAP